MLYFSLIIAIAISIQCVMKTDISNHISNYSKELVILEKLEDKNYIIACEVIFDVYKHGYSIDVPSYYYEQNPTAYNRIIYYFNIVPLINYNKIRQCQIDDMILYINKLDTRYMDVFSIVS
jgi:hypothetical protein